MWFQGKYPVKDLTVESIEDSEEKTNAFEISGKV